MDWKQPVTPVERLIISQISSNVKRYYPLSQAIQGTEISILTGLERPVQLLHKEDGVRVAYVSILTGLERPVQRPDHPKGLTDFGVSILTGLERPVQHILGYSARAWAQGFNPHRP